MTAPRTPLATLALLAAALLVAGTQPAAAQAPPIWTGAEVFVKIPGVNGHSYPQVPGWGDDIVKVHAIDHEVFSEPDPGGGAGRPVANAITLFTDIFRGTPQLYPLLTQGTAVDGVEIRWYALDLTGQLEHKYTMVLNGVLIVEVKNLMLTQFDPSYADYGPRLQVKVTFSSVTWEYVADGTTAQWTPGPAKAAGAKK